MNLLIVGGGAREHALAWKLLRDDPSVSVVAAPGNPGLAQIARCVAVSPYDVTALAALARSTAATFTLVGPEAPLAEGIVDHFRANGLAVFGPTKAAAQIETSKRFAKELMRAAGVPTASALTCTTATDARAEARRLGVPVVIKASGLASGKGVTVAENIEEADAAIAAMLEHGTFGAAGKEVLVEEFMEGEEISLFVLTDGVNLLPMLAAQDHKRVGEGDTGANTGGMGAYAPVGIATPSVIEAVIDRVLRPVLRSLAAAGTPFTGLLYAGVMLTREGPRVVEFNCRFGDPETEALLPLLTSSLLDPMRAIAQGESIAGAPALVWRAGAAVTTVVATQGYPGTSRTGDAIVLPPLPDDVMVFHSGTARRDNGSLVTAGGRVLAVTAVAESVAAAQEKSAAYATQVQFTGRQFRRDIGWRELARQRAGA